MKAVRILLWLPLLAFLGFLALVAGGLIAPADRTIGSKLIGQPMPAFALPAALSAKPGLAAADLARGRPRLVNLFASWCLPCATESAQLAALAKAGVEIDGVAIRDTPADLARFLARYGDPYARIGADRDSAVQLALGSSGVPETFVVDARGIIRHQHIGEIRAEDVPAILRALAAAR